MIELSRLSLRLLPTGGGVGQAAAYLEPCPLAVDPFPQTGPLLEQGFVGDLDHRLAGDRVVIERQQPGVHPVLDQRGVDRPCRPEPETPAQQRLVVLADDHQAREQFGRIVLGGAVE